MRPTIIISTILMCLFTGLSNGQIVHDPADKTVRITTTDQKLSLLINYSRGCRISTLEVNGVNTLSPSGIFTAVRAANGSWQSWGERQQLSVKERPGRIIIDGIRYGKIGESWSFTLDGNKIAWTISRRYDEDQLLEEMALPVWHFADISTWKGGILDNGGVVWCKYLAAPNDTYGVHTGGVTFWNEESGDALKISARADGSRSIATKYSQDEQGCVYLHSPRHRQRSASTLPPEPVCFPKGGYICTF
ncbi:hypothetical protein [Chitinophaga sp. XS-30]|uniref:hypothetical protein n=1 Tax=Chitinophaga sp. XS-30 TaxID=2604421 RepID=UPI0011DD07DC|nr:hypothetical protein [Chitinophaga sp. XS-30]QEH41778.1 hypothetical protein FW415_13145 [Chitinophaga sp. XS-30]